MENNNHIPDQYKGVLEELNNKIYRVREDNSIKNGNIKRQKIYNLFFNFMIKNFPKGTNLADLINITSAIIREHRIFAFEIITSCTRGCIAKGESLENIGKSFSNIIKRNGISQNLASDIIDGFVIGCLMQKPDNIEDMQTGFSNLLNGTGYEEEYNLQNLIKVFYAQYEENLENLEKEIKNITNAGILDDEKKEIIYNAFFNFILYNVQEKKGSKSLIKTVSKIITNNPEFAFDIITSFTESFICKGKSLKGISTDISGIINTDGIKNKKNLVANIINGFTYSCIIRQHKWEDIIKGISNIIKTEGRKNNQNLVSNIIYGFTYCIIKRRKWEDIINGISNIIKTEGIKNNQNLVSNIISGFTQGCIIKRRKWKNINIGKGISSIIKTEGIKNNQNLVSNIINGFTQGCIIKRQNWEDMINGISNIIKTEGIKNNQNLVSNIISGFTQGYILQQQIDIGNGIYNILNDEEIKGDSNLVSNIINGFVKGYLQLRPYNIKEIAEIFSKLLDIDFGTKKTKIKSELEPIFLSIISQHLTNTSTKSSNKQLLGKDKEDTETQLLNCYKKLFNERDSGKINSFQDIIFKYFGFDGKQDVKSEKNNDSCYHSLKRFCPLTNILNKEGDATGECLTEPDQEKTGEEPDQEKTWDLHAKNSKKREYGRIFNSAKRRTTRSTIL